MAQADETRWSTATAVDVEAGLRAAEKAERAEKAEKAEKAGGWLRRPARDKGGEPSTPPLPLQNYAPSPSTPLPPGMNPILGTGGYAVSNDTTGYLVPSGSGNAPAPLPATATAPTPALVPKPFAAPTVAISSPKPPPRTPLPPPPIVLGLPPSPRTRANSKHARAPSLGAGVGGPSGSRSLTSYEIRRSRSAQVMRESTQMEAGDEVRRFPPCPPSAIFIARILLTTELLFISRYSLHPRVGGSPSSNHANRTFRSTLTSQRTPTHARPLV